MSLVRFRPEAPHNADLAHLVERDLAKVEVAGSSPVIRSKETGTLQVVPVNFTSMQFDRIADNIKVVLDIRSTEY